MTTNEFTLKEIKEGYDILRQVSNPKELDQSPVRYPLAVTIAFDDLLEAMGKYAKRYDKETLPFMKELGVEFPGGAGWYIPANNMEAKEKFLEQTKIISETKINLTYPEIEEKFLVSFGVRMTQAERHTLKKFFKIENKEEENKK